MIEEEIVVEEDKILDLKTLQRTARGMKRLLARSQEALNTTMKRKKIKSKVIKKTEIKEAKKNEIKEPHVKNNLRKILRVTNSTNSTNYPKRSNSNQLAQRKNSSQSNRTGLLQWSAVRIEKSKRMKLRSELQI